ncbi:MAG: hypothetical protein RIS64_2558 [Bacteroidota bacterium]|jgi:esterase/lipase superfamily enzyme
MNEQHHQWYSPHLGGDFQMLTYGDKGYPIIIFPTTMGSFHEARDKGLIESARWFVEQGLIRLYCVDSIDRQSWYNRSVSPSKRAENHTWYDKLIRWELIERIRKTTGFTKVGVAGCSFGGYHAANIAFRYPDAVSHLMSMSGAFDIRDFVGAHYDDNVYFNNPLDYIPNLDKPELWQMKICLGTSDRDICLAANLQMSEILNAKKVNHWLDCRPNATHDWPVWKEMFPHYLSFVY